MGKTFKKVVFSSNVQPRRIVKPARTSWRCDECGKSNDPHFVQCNHCGAYEA